MDRSLRWSHGVGAFERPCEISDCDSVRSSLRPVDDARAAALKAHQQLDRAVDRCYRPEPFPSDRHRVEYLFALYEQLTAPLVAAAKPPRKARGVQAVP